MYGHTWSDDRWQATTEYRGGFIARVTLVWSSSSTTLPDVLRGQSVLHAAVDGVEQHWQSARMPWWQQRSEVLSSDNETITVKPRLNQIHVAGYMYPGRATCIRLHVDGYKF